MIDTGGDVLSDSTPEDVKIFDASIYSNEALLRAAYDCAAHGTVVVSRKNTIFHVALVDTPSCEFFWKRFIEAVTDHQLRLATERQFGTIREILLLQALAPVENLSTLLASQEK